MISGILLMGNKDPHKYQLAWEVALIVLGSIVYFLWTVLSQPS